MKNVKWLFPGKIFASPTLGTEETLQRNVTEEFSVDHNSKGYTLRVIVEGYAGLPVRQVFSCNPQGETSDSWQDSDGPDEKEIPEESLAFQRELVGFVRLLAMRLSAHVGVDFLREEFHLTVDEYCPPGWPDTVPDPGQLLGEIQELLDSCIQAG